MKMWNKLWTVLLTAALLVGTRGIAVEAAGAYTYTVTFYAGNQGTFAGTEHVTVSNADAVVTPGAEKIVVSGLKTGDKVGITAQSAVTLGTDSKYYVQGIRMSGRDNSTVSASVFEVDGDRDYVVAYGIKGNQVKYTVNYQDEAGNVLAKSDTFYGNIGDKPVVAYKYIDGYFPKAFGLTKTLNANEAENVFTFVYTTMPETVVNQEIREETVTQVVPGGVNVAGGNAGGGAGGNEGVQGGGTGEDAEAGANTEDAEAGTEAGTESGNDDIIVDLDEEEVPLADTEQVTGEAEVDGSMKTYAALIGAGVAALVLIAVLLVYLKKKH